MKTYSAKPDDIDPDWWHVDLEGETLGRAASQIATLIRGKHKPLFTPHVDCGDYVVVTNCEKVEMSGSKFQNKMYRRHTGYPGGLNEISAEELLERQPERIIEFAVKGMLPKNKLGKKMLQKLKVYVGTDHPHEPQNPKPFDIE